MCIQLRFSFFCRYMMRKYNAVTSGRHQFKLEHTTFPVLICPRVDPLVVEASAPDQEDNEFLLSSPPSMPPPGFPVQPQGVHRPSQAGAAAAGRAGRPQNVAPPPMLQLSLAASVFELPPEASHTRPRDVSTERQQGESPVTMQHHLLPPTPAPILTYSMSAEEAIKKHVFSVLCFRFD
jgi:hypothetical protein